MPKPDDAALMDRLTELFLQPIRVKIGDNAYMHSSDKVVLSIRMIESEKHKRLRPDYHYARNHKHDVLVDKDMLIELLQNMLEDLTHEQSRAGRCPSDRAVPENAGGAPDHQASPA